VLNAAGRVTILAGAGCAGAHDQLIALAAALKAPVVHAFRGKEFIEYDNPYDVGMTGLIGFGSGYRAMEHCDALVMLGTDFPYRPFFPEGVPVIQVDVRGEHIGRRVTYGTDLDNPDFAGMARAAGLFGVRVDKAGELEDALKEAFGHDGPALVDVRTARQELSLPPNLTYGQIKGFTLWATRTVLSGGGEELVELAKTNLRELDVE
jgi:thiamine pyrophosphate-dependent acetolactate synthase large subunit-like protein